MAWQPTKPAATDQLSVSQGDLQGNFGALDTFANKNHYGPASPNSGKHQFIELPTQSPVPTTVAGEVGLYSQVSSITSQPELVFAHQFGSTAPATAQIVEFTSAGWDNPGWARLPSGILLIWSNANTGSNTSGLTYTVNFPSTAGFPAFAAVYNIQLSGTWDGTSSDPNVAYYVGPVTIGTPGSFVVRQQGRALGNPTQHTFNYLAIGI